MTRPGSIPLHEHDPWPQRLVIAFLGVTLILSTVAIAVLLYLDRNVTGFFPIPTAITLSLSMILSRRPPWTAQDPNRTPPQ